MSLLFVGLYNKVWVGNVRIVILINAWIYMQYLFYDLKVWDYNILWWLEETSVSTVSSKVTSIKKKILPSPAGFKQHQHQPGWDSINLFVDPAVALRHLVTLPLQCSILEKVFSHRQCFSQNQNQKTRDQHVNFKLGNISEATPLVHKLVRTLHCHVMLLLFLIFHQIQKTANHHT